MNFLDGLNPQQREAVATIEGPILILAGAGSGKTRVITHRIAHMVQRRFAPAQGVMAVTFTNKAADEMRTRVAELLERAGLPESPRISTFHSFCVRLLRRDGEPLAQVRPGFTTQFTIYDDEDQVALIKQIYRQLAIDEKAFLQVRAMLSRISQGKSQKLTPQDFYKNSTDPKSQKAAVVYDEYERALRRANALDFDDLLLESVRLLANDAGTRDSWNRRLSAIMVDEYQDTNRSQYELMRLLSQQHSNVCVVGDEDQSIYSWRGADIRNILDFEKDFPDALTIRLEQNYRSTKNILEAASAVVANNTERKGKWLWTDAESGSLVGVYAAFDGENEALFIADSIERVLAQDPHEQVAVLYRTNAQSRQIEEALRRYGRKYLVVGGFSFYQRAEVKDVVAYLKLATAHHDSISLQRIINTPARGIGKTTVEQIEQFAREHQLSHWDAIGQMLEARKFPARAEASLKAFRTLISDLGAMIETQPVDAIIRELMGRSGYKRMLEEDATPESEARMENLTELISAAAEGAERGETLTEFLDHVALVADSDQLDNDAQVLLLTLHNAKGLEFPVVFLAGMEEGLFPHSRSAASASMLEEERRLCYVGMTRARKRLYLTWARYRRRYGNSEQERTVPSRFLSELPEQLVDKLSGNDSIPQVNLFTERYEVRQTAQRSTYTGKTYNSLNNIAQFFEERGIQYDASKIAPPPRAPEAAPRPAAAPPAPPAPPPAAAAPPRPYLVPPRPAAQAPVPLQRPPGSAPASKAPAGFRVGAVVNHPKYGRGTIVKREGDGEDAKITVSFPGVGLKKLIERYAGFK